MHNMIVEDERDLHHQDVDDNDEFEYDDLDGNIVRSFDFEITVRSAPEQPLQFGEILTSIGKMHNPQKHRELREDLKQHLIANFRPYKKNSQR